MSSHDVYKKQNFVYTLLIVTVMCTTATGRYRKWRKNTKSLIIIKNASVCGHLYLYLPLILHLLTSIYRICTMQSEKRRSALELTLSDLAAERLVSLECATEPCHSILNKFSCFSLFVFFRSRTVQRNVMENDFRPGIKCSFANTCIRKYIFLFWSCLAPNIHKIQFLNTFCCRSLPPAHIASLTIS